MAYIRGNLNKCFLIVLFNWFVKLFYLLIYLLHLIILITIILLYLTPLENICLMRSITTYVIFC